MRARTSIFFVLAVVVIDPCRVVTQEVHSIRYLIKASRHAKEKVGATVKRECAFASGKLVVHS